jgi:hypothetical protein
MNERPSLDYVDACEVPLHSQSRYLAMIISNIEDGDGDEDDDHPHK